MSGNPNVPKLNLPPAEKEGDGDGSFSFRGPAAEEADPPKAVAAAVVEDAGKAVVVEKGASGNEAQKPAQAPQTVPSKEPKVPVMSNLPEVPRPAD